MLSHPPPSRPLPPPDAPIAASDLFDPSKEKSFYVSGGLAEVNGGITVKITDTESLFVAICQVIEVTSQPDKYPEDACPPKTVTA